MSTNRVWGVPTTSPHAINTNMDSANQDFVQVHSKLEQVRSIAPKICCNIRNANGEQTILEPQNPQP